MWVLMLSYTNDVGGADVTVYGVGETIDDNGTKEDLLTMGVIVVYPVGNIILSAEQENTDRDIDDDETKFSTTTYGIRVEGGPIKLEASDSTSTNYVDSDDEFEDENSIVSASYSMGGTTLTFASQSDYCGETYATTDTTKGE